MEHTQSWIDFVELIAKNEMVRSDGEIRKWVTFRKEEFDMASSKLQQTVCNGN